MSVAVASPPVPDRIAFKHPFFSALKDVVFLNGEARGEPVLRFPLDDAHAELPLPGIKKELKLADDSPDARMLDIVAGALRFVSSIMIGEAVPSELSSGKASWEITDRHRTVARARLSMQLVSWMSGDESVIIDASQLAMVADDPAMKEKIGTAFGEAAKKLGIPPERKEEVINLVDSLGEELAYIEALRDQFTHITVVEAGLGKLSEIYRSDRGVAESLLQVSKLCAIPMREFRGKFEEIDAQTGEIISVLKNIAIQIKFVRECRDDLHQRFWAWMPLAESWSLCPMKRSSTGEKLIDETYRFLARRFLPQKEWELFSKSQENAAKKATESKW